MYSNTPASVAARVNQTLLIDNLANSYIFCTSAQLDGKDPQDALWYLRDDYYAGLLLRSHSDSWGVAFSIRKLYLQIKPEATLLHLKSDAQLSQELTALIAHGDVMVFREENRYDQLAAARRWQDVPPAGSSQLSVPKSAKSSPSNNSNNAGPGVSQPTAQGGKVATAATTPVLEPLDLYCALPNGKPAAGLPYKATLATGQVLQGKLDAKGFAHFTNLEPSKVDVEFGEQPDEAAIKATRSQIASALDSMLAEERAEGAAFESTYAELNLAEKGLVSTGALFTGIWRGVTDLAEFANNVYELGAPQQQLKRAVNAAWSAYDTDSDNWAATFADNWQDSQHQAFVKVLGFDPSAISKKDIAEAYEIASFIYDDAETKALLMEFGKDYVSAQHHTELTDMAGTAVFEIILGALLAVATGGAGTAAMAASKLSKLKKLGGLFKKLGSELKKKVRFKKKSGGTNSKVEEAIGKPLQAEVPKPGDKPETKKEGQGEPERREDPPPPPRYTKEEQKFLDDYKKRFPNTTLSDDELIARHRAGKRMSPDTDRLHDPERKARPKPDIGAKIAGQKEVAFDDLPEKHQRKLKKLEYQRKQAYEAKLAAVKAQDEVASKAATQQMKDISEKMGEVSAEGVMKVEYPDFKRVKSNLPGNGKQGQFDQIYHNPKTGEIIVVEAKGGGATRGVRKGLDGKYAEQGTKAYRDSIIHNMNKKLNTALDDPRYGVDDKYTRDIDQLDDTVSKLNKAQLNDDSIISKQVSQRLNSDGSLKPTAELIDFK
ncbi:hypothetical protein DU002_11260 [Corallincola holothuriorum]|uniref:Uncharacterized protein n=1 Tax=Corallincola holothuriorum TaxID=2282215 RepID=A0A368NHZ2_9GAMM|nr:hypothetical protein [Corallincola holothuriorum]RCU49493.1 hypothetical protein DU002_11260 [Corallincola holothuriorum]